MAAWWTMPIPARRTGTDVRKRTNRLSVVVLLALATSLAAPAGFDAFNPVFDVTPAALIDAIVCERGVFEKPTRERVLFVLQKGP